jgi:hypothetical protein
MRGTFHVCDKRSVRRRDILIQMSGNGTDDGLMLWSSNGKNLVGTGCVQR